MRKISYGEYLWKTTKWLLGNLFFGLFPIIFMWTLYLLSDHKFGEHEISEQIYEGAILFVLLAIVGAVFTDFYLSGIHYNGLPRLMTCVTPILILAIVGMNYLLIKLKVITRDRFSITSYTSIVVIVLSIIYITFVKTNLYIKEDEKHATSV